ncbi:MAG: GatB/YqeY domain-containing protein [Chloroflexota bacterium]
MNLKQRLLDDMKQAMRSGDLAKRDALRFVMAAIKQIEKDTLTELDDSGVLAVLQKQAKNREETISDFQAAGRPDDAAADVADLEIIRSYLPQQVSEEAIQSRAIEMIEELGLAGPQGIGAAMKALMAEFKGRADGKTVNQIVRKLLN